MDRSPKQPPPLPRPKVEPPNDWRGKILADRYQLGVQLGAGGFGVVYRAWDRRARAAVAIKVLREEFGGRAALRRRFAREAKALLTLSHPNIVGITDCGLADGLPFFSMELLEGHSLERELKRNGPLPAHRCKTLILQLLAGLSYVHGRGLVHRDLKPGNIFMQRQPDGEERVKLLDFGLAKFVEPTDLTESQSLTGSGEVVGTPAYMPPEQLASQQGDHRSDVYSAAVVLFQMLSGRRPFEGEPYDVLRMVLVEPAPALSAVCEGREIHPELDAILAKALLKDPADRYPDADAFAEALSALPDPSEWLGPGAPEQEPVPSDEHTERLSVREPERVAESGEEPETDGNSTIIGVAGSPPRRLPAVRLVMFCTLCVLGSVFALAPGFGDRLRPMLRGHLPADLPWTARSAGGPADLQQDPLGPDPGWPVVLADDAGCGAEGCTPAPPEPRAFARATDPAVPAEHVLPAAALESASGTPIAAARGARVEEGGLSAAQGSAPDGPGPASEAAADAPPAADQEAQAEAGESAIGGEGSDPGSAEGVEGPAAGEGGAPSAAGNGDEASAAPEPEPAPAAADEEPAAADKEPAAADEEPEPSRVKARNPWVRGVPRALRGLRRRVLRGDRGDKRTAAYLRRYNHKHREDPRGHLLMAGLYMNRNWETDALTQYQFALKREPSVRGDPRVLKDLLELAGHRGTARRAASTVREAFGPEAKPALEKAIAQAEEEEMRQYLMRLRESLEGAP